MDLVRICTVVVAVVASAEILIQIRGTGSQQQANARKEMAPRLLNDS